MSSRANATIANADLETPAIPVFPVPECGLNSDQVWATVIAEVVARGDVGRANVDTWLRATALIGRGEDAGLIVGASSAMAQRRIAGRFLPPLRAAATAVLGSRVPVEVVIAREWLRANPEEATGPVRPPGGGRGRITISRRDCPLCGRCILGRLTGGGSTVWWGRRSFVWAGITCVARPAPACVGCCL